MITQKSKILGDVHKLDSYIQGFNMSNAQGHPMIQYCKSVMKKDTCKLILHKFRSKETDDVEFVDNVAQPDDSIRDDFKYRDSRGRLCWSVTPMSKNFEYFYEKVMPAIPEHVDFEFISYVSVIEYPTDTYINMHKDSADEFDTATAIITLDEDYTGGSLIVDDVTFKTKTGDMICFNHSNAIYHGTTPVKSGIRTILAVWFQTEFSHKPLENEIQEPVIDMNSTETYNALL